MIRYFCDGCGGEVAHRDSLIKIDGGDWRAEVCTLTCLKSWAERFTTPIDVRSIFSAN